MAFGISPRYAETQTFDNSTSQEILLLALEAVKKEGWEPSFIGSSRIVAYSSMTVNSWSEKITFTIEGHSLTVQSESASSQIMDWGKNKQNVRAFFDSFFVVRAALSAEEIHEKISGITFTPSENSVQEESFETSHDRIQNFWSIFIPVKGYFVTPIILNLNLLVFIIQIATGVNVFSPDTDTLLLWGANFRPLTLSGEGWRLLTCCFLHIGILHLVLNMYALVSIGLLLELRLGTARFLAAYLLCGIAGSIASVYWNELTVSAGASGAIFGMYGVFLALLTTNLIEKNARMNFLASIVVFVGYNLLAGLRGQIDNAAHIGGLVSGMVIGYTFYLSLLRPDLTSWRYGSIGVATALVLLASLLVYSKTPNDLPVYDQKMEEFSVLEDQAMSPLRMSDSVADSVLYEEMKKGIILWNEALLVIRAAEKLNIPEPLRERDNKLINYCYLRINVYEAVIKSIEENTDRYNSEIVSYNLQINQLVDELMSAEPQQTD